MNEPIFPINLPEGQRPDLSQISGRSKVILMQALMEDLGISAAFIREFEGTARAQQIIADQWTFHWSEK